MPKRLISCLSILAWSAVAVVLSVLQTVRSYKRTSSQKRFSVKNKQRRLLKMAKLLRISVSPHIHSGRSTAGIMRDVMIALLPAAVTLPVSIVAFEAQQMLLGIYASAGRMEELTPEGRAFRVSVTTAVLYVLTFFALVLIRTETSVLWATVINLLMILTPGLCVVGLLAFLPTLARTRGGARTFLLLFVGFLICCSGIGVIYVLSMFGAYHVIMTAVHKKMLQSLAGATQNGAHHGSSYEGDNASADETDHKSNEGNEGNENKNDNEKD
jgi:hypothetical protein